MPKNDLTYLSHIFDCICDIETFCKDYTEESFISDKKSFNACIRMFEVIGEATKRISTETRNKYQEVEWKKMAGFRDVLIHDYEGIDLIAMWEIIQKNIPDLKQKIERIIKNI